MMARSLASETLGGDLRRRLAALRPDSTRRWGTLTVDEMLCHVADSFRATLGERRASPLKTSRLQARVMKFVALRTPLPWPKGLPTRPEVNPHQGGTRPEAFAADRAALEALVARFASPSARYDVHPMFGAMSRDEWLIWGYRHLDHHLRQFGV
jgi:hypothetical protein